MISIESALKLKIKEIDGLKPDATASGETGFSERDGIIPTVKRKSSLTLIVCIGKVMQLTSSSLSERGKRHR